MSQERAIHLTNSTIENNILNSIHHINVIINNFAYHNIQRNNFL